MHAISMLIRPADHIVPGIYPNRRTYRKAMNDPERSDTLAPPTDRDAPTQVEAAPRPAVAPPAALSVADEASVERRPKGASNPPSDFFERAYFELVRVHEEQKTRDADLYDQDGKFANLMGGVLGRRFDAFEKALEPRFTGIELKISKQAENVFALELRIKTMEDHLAELRKEVDRLKDQRGTPEQTAAQA